VAPLLVLVAVVVVSGVVSPEVIRECMPRLGHQRRELGMRQRPLDHLRALFFGIAETFWGGALACCLALGSMVAILATFHLVHG
jgi:hypothetical protein